MGNFPVFEGTSLYSLRLDHNLSTNHRLTLRANVSPSTVTGIEVSGQDQPFGQNAYSRTSQQTYRDVAGVFQEPGPSATTRSTNSASSMPAADFPTSTTRRFPEAPTRPSTFPAIAYFGREPYSYIQRTEQRYQFTDNFSWTIGRHNTKFGADFNYLPLTATFTVNYGGVYDFGSFQCRQPRLRATPAACPLSPISRPCRPTALGCPEISSRASAVPATRSTTFPSASFWQDSWRVSPNVTLNYGVRYDVEIPPKFTPPQGLALPAYNLLGLQKGIQTDKNNIQPRIGLAWDPEGDGKTVVRASYGMFYDHPLLGLYFLGDASDGSSSGQLAFAGPDSAPAPAIPAT